MRTFGKWLGRILLMLVLAIVVIGLWKREEITRLMAVQSLFDPEKIVNNFSNMESAFLASPVSRGNSTPSTLPHGTPAKMPDALPQWIEGQHVTAMIVMKNGAVVYEDYFKGTTAEDRRIGWSVAKSYLSALVGVLIDEGSIASLDDQVTQYAPQLVGGAYDGTTLRQVLHMSSGVLFDENYADQSSDINRMGRVLALGGEMDSFATDLSETFEAPGTVWQYVSIDTHIVGMVVRGATGRSIPDLLSEKIIIPLGLEHDAYYLTDGVGTAFVLGGLNASTRDYARFGQMILQQGMWQGRQILPTGWVRASTNSTAPPAGPDAPASGRYYNYGLHWWIPKDSTGREYLARGIYGQYIYVNETEAAVIVVNATNAQFRAPGVDPSNVEMFRAITRGL